MALTKQQFLDHLRALYRAANRADADDKAPEEAWMSPDMAGYMAARHLDAMLHDMVDADVLTKEEHQRLLEEV